jgi:hypothetical protein
VSERDNGKHDRVERALEVFVYAPLGLGLWIRDLAPTLIDTVVARGRAEIDRRQEQTQQHITTARSMGQVAIAFGVPELRKRAGQQVDQVRERVDKVVENLVARDDGSSSIESVADIADEAPIVASEPIDEPAAVATDDVDTAAAGRRSASSAHLPIPGYDALSASQVVERLAGLGADELVEVRDYENAHRHRRTILGKIDQLTA